MSGSGRGQNSYLYGGADGNAAAVTAGGNLGIQFYFDKIKNIGRYVLRTGTVLRLPDVPANGIMVFSKEGNGYIWWSGYGTNNPAINVGTPLLEGRPRVILCTNANQVSFIPEVDGDTIYVIAYGSGRDVILTPNNPAALDLIAPTVSSTSPTTGATSVSRSTTITLTFSEALDPLTVSSSTVTISPTITSPTISPDSADATKIVILPSTTLAAATLYTVTAGVGITDTSSNHLAAPYSFTFTTAAVAPTTDTTPPTIVSSNITNGQASVAIATVPSFTFSEALNVASIDNSNIKAFLADNIQEIPNLTFTLSTDKKTITVTGGLTFAQATNYILAVYGSADGVVAVKDLAGNQLVTTYTISFATATTPGAASKSYNVVGNDYEDICNDSGGNIETSIWLKSASSKINGLVPIKYQFTIWRTGSLSGSAYLVWQRLNSSGKYTDFKVLKTISASGISTKEQLIIVDASSNKSALQTNDKITFRYNGGDFNHCISIKETNYDAFDGENTSNQNLGADGKLYNYPSVDLAFVIDFAA